MYGGLSQDIRTRYGNLGFGFNFVKKAKVDSILHSSRFKKYNEIWKAKLILNKMYG